MTNPAVQFSVHSLLLTARGVHCISTFPSIPALNASSVSLAGFSCSVLNSVLPAAAQVPAWTGWQLPRYSCRVTVTPSGFSVSTALTAVREEVTWGRGQEYYPLQTTFYSVWNWPKIVCFQGERYTKWTFMLILQFLQSSLRHRFLFKWFSDAIHQRIQPLQYVSQESLGLTQEQYITLVFL